MARAKKRYTVMFKNDMGSGKLGTFTKLEKAEHEVQANISHDNNEIRQGYPDLHATYWIEESTVY